MQLSRDNRDLATPASTLVPAAGDRGDDHHPQPDSSGNKSLCVQQQPQNTPADAGDNRLNSFTSAINSRARGRDSTPSNTSRSQSVSRAFITNRVRVPRGYFPTVRSSSENDTASKNQGLARGSAGLSRRRALVSHKRGISSDRNHLDFSIIRRTSRRELRGFDACAICLKPSPLAPSDSNHQARRIPKSIQVSLLVAASERG